MIDAHILVIDNTPDLRALYVDTFAGEGYCVTRMEHVPADRELALLADQLPQARARLEEMRSLYVFFEERLPALIKEREASWRAHHHAR
jgi:hypothetical protein